MRIRKASFESDKCARGSFLKKITTVITALWVMNRLYKCRRWRLMVRVHVGCIRIVFILARNKPPTTIFFSLVFLIRPEIVGVFAVVAASVSESEIFISYLPSSTVQTVGALTMHERLNGIFLHSVYTDRSVNAIRRLYYTAVLVFRFEWFTLWWLLVFITVLEEICACNLCYSSCRMPKPPNPLFKQPSFNQIKLSDRFPFAEIMIARETLNGLLVTGIIESNGFFRTWRGLI